MTKNKPFQIEHNSARPSARIARVVGKTPNPPTDFDVVLDMLDGRRAEGEVTLVFDAGAWHSCLQLRGFGPGDIYPWIHGAPLVRLLGQLPAALCQDVLRELAAGPPVIA